MYFWGNILSNPSKVSGPALHNLVRSICLNAKTDWDAAKVILAYIEKPTHVLYTTALLAEQHCRTLYVDLNNYEGLLLKGYEGQAAILMRKCQTNYSALCGLPTGDTNQSVVRKIDDLFRAFANLAFVKEETRRGFFSFHHTRATRQHDQMLDETLASRSW